MNERTVLALVDDPIQHETTVETAFTLAREYRAHLDVLHVKSNPATPAAFIEGEVSEELLDHLKRQNEQNSAELMQQIRNLFDRCCKQFEVPAVDDHPPADRASATWIARPGIREELLVHRGRLADLIIVARPTDQVMFDRDFFAFHTALRETGRPILVAPPATPSAIGHTIGVAWNGSLEATRAVAGALPFLEAAEEVMIFTAESDRTPGSAASELAVYLRRHGIKATPRVFKKSMHTPVGKAILERCWELKVDLLVLGAYTHSRLRELLMGGVTQYALGHAEIPMIMAH